ncbi:MAG: radical SAM protein, partial [Deltaproteobacteria bacterium]|nr:radical SAM protein [Deltaproteobacteria bacterium]
PTYTDNIERVKRMCDWILENLGPDYPLHFSRFHPRYKLTHLPPTPISFLENAWKTAMKMGVHYVYVGNVPPSDWNHTYCPSCKKKIIDRTGYYIGEIHVNDGKCAFCKEPIAGVWN